LNAEEKDMPQYQRAVPQEQSWNSYVVQVGEKRSLGEDIELRIPKCLR
jgi:hypothetical protein